LDRWSAEGGHEGNRGDTLVTNGEHLLAVHRNGGMAYRVLKGRHDVEDLLGEAGVRHSRIPTVETTRFSLIVSEVAHVPAGWTPVADRCIVTLTRGDDPSFEPL